MNAVEAVGLTKYYGKHLGIVDVDLQVRTGEVFGFLGPNGAGKTTTIRLLVDLLRPSRGRVKVLGLDPRADSVAIRRRVGYVPGDLALYRDMTGRRLCAYFAALRGLDASARMEELAERLDLDLDRPIGDYSTGNRQKVGLIQAFMHDPELLILDEPTAGLDPLIQQEFYAMLNEAVGRGHTVFLSSHVLPEVERVAHRVGIIRRGRLLVVEEVTKLKARALRRIELHLGRPVDPSILATMDSVRSVESLDGGTVLILTVEGSLDQVVKTVAGFEVRNIISHEADLEDVFLEYYRGDQA